MTDDHCDNRLKSFGQSEFFRNAGAVKPRQRSAHPTGTQRTRVCRQHEVLRGAAAVDACFPVLADRSPGVNGFKYIHDRLRCAGVTNDEQGNCRIPLSNANYKP